MADPETVKIKQIRKIILQNLNMMYPSGLQNDSLYRTVLPVDLTYDIGLFKKDIIYLHEKGYIEFVDDAIGGVDFEKKVARLTAEGKEIAERTMSDPALEI